MKFFSEMTIHGRVKVIIILNSNSIMLPFLALVVSMSAISTVCCYFII